MQLRCSKPCGVVALRLREDRVCPDCGAPLELVPERPAASAAELRAIWSERRSSIEPADRSGVWRFRELLAGLTRLADAADAYHLRFASSRDAAGLLSREFRHIPTETSR